MILLTVISRRKEYESLPDAELMAQTQKGKTMAFEILVNRYKKRAYYIALSLVGDHDEATDLSQETFVRIYQTRKRYFTQMPFFSWFYTILSNLAKNHLKKRMVRFEHARKSTEEYNPNLDGPPSPEFFVESDETRRAVWQAIEKLSFEHREVIVLRHFEDLSYEEIANLLSIPVGSVMSRLYYARKKLREVIEKSHGR